MIARRVFLASLVVPAIAEGSSLARPEASVIRYVYKHSPRLVEIGAGDGEWARALMSMGVKVRAYDIISHPAPVMLGSHINAASDYPEFPDMLAVWPPDGNAFDTWVMVAPWVNIYAVGNRKRFLFRDTLQGYELVSTTRLTPGSEGGNQFFHWRRLS